MKVTVKIIVTTEDDDKGRSAMEVEHAYACGDNPRYYYADTAACIQETTAGLVGQSLALARSQSKAEVPADGWMPIRCAL